MFLESGDAAAEAADEVVLLGLANGTAYFALDYSKQLEPPLSDVGVFRDLRAVGAILSHQPGTLLAYARGIVYWHVRHRFCG